MGTSKCALYICSVTQRNVANKNAFMWKSNSSFLSFIIHSLVLQGASEYSKWFITFHVDIFSLHQLLIYKISMKIISF
jgi:hypothetical protein